jgi:putative membrane protein
MTDPIAPSSGLPGDTLGAEPGASTDSPAARAIIAILTAVVLSLVFMLIYGVPHQVPPDGPSPLATLNALMNGSAACCLILGYMAIRARKLTVHRWCMLSAFTFSTLFLVGYVLHHATAGSVPFRGEGVLRVVYFSLLIPHVLLAAPVLPMALFTLYRGLTDKRVAHRRIARITLPLWLFVSVSGVIVYLLLYHS